MGFHAILLQYLTNIFFIATMIALIRANCEFLRQGIELLEKHQNSTYVNSNPSTFGSSIGAHMRHVLDHYGSFLKGVAGGVVDYDDRVRDTVVEKDVSAAIDRIKEISAELTELEQMADLPVGVMVSASATDEEEKSNSSFGRELQFLVSHTVHHYALIAIASRMQGIAPDSTFGVAPSTLKYLQATAS